MRSVFFHRHKGAQRVLARLEGLAQHDVDGAGNGAGTELGHRRAQDLDALDLIGLNGIHREAGRHAFAVHQDLGVATAQAAHARVATAPGTTAHGHSRQALENLSHRGITHAFDFVSPVDDA